jgi:hypothetical protein
MIHGVRWKKSNIILHSCMSQPAVIINYKFVVICKKRTIMRGPFLWGMLYTYILMIYYKLLI